MPRTPGKKSTVRTWFNGVIRETLEGGAVSEEAVTVQQHNCNQQNYNSFRLYPRLHSFPSDESDTELDMQNSKWNGARIWKIICLKMIGKQSQMKQ